MRIHLLVWVLLTSLACAQAAPQALPPDTGTANPDAPNTVAKIQVGPDEPVITVNNFCPSGPQPDGSCKTIITRAQFEKLAEALQPGMALPLRLKVANAYAQIMRMAVAAEKRSLDKTSAFDEEMRYARMQMLSQDLTRALQEDANRISDADLEDYYRKNESSFEEATVARIFIPHDKRAAHPSEKREATADSGAAQPHEGQEKDDTQEKADEEAMTQLAVDLRARAVNGEDPDKLQTEAYAAAGLPGIIPNTKLEKVRRATLPPQHESVMELKPGEISAVFSDPGGAHFIYKMIVKHVLTLDDAKPEIRDQISSQRFRDSMKPFQGDTVFSDAYFNPPGLSTTPPHRNPKDRKKNAPPGF